MFLIMVMISITINCYLRLFFAACILFLTPQQKAANIALKQFATLKVYLSNFVEFCC